MIEVSLPFPSNRLSPNQRLHWAALAAAKKGYKTTCFILAKQQLGSDFPPLVGKHRIEIYFYPPRKHRYDHDNLIARMKSGIDGLALALGCDDKDFQPLFTEICDPVKDGKVLIRLMKVN